MWLTVVVQISFPATGITLLPVIPTMAFNSSHLKRMPGRMSDRMSEDMPDRMSEDIPDRMPEDNFAR